MTNHKLSDLLDMTAVQRLAEANYQATGMPIGIIGAQDGSVLVGTGWQDICLRFHRANPASLKRCEESDRVITDRLAEGESRQYKCLNGLWDIGIPIVVAGKHLATLFLGQFFYEDEVPDREFFVQQAREFGFDLDGYLAALDRVRVFSREKVEYIVAYNKSLAGFIADLAEQALQKLKADEDLLLANLLLRTQLETSLDGILIVDEAGRIISYNQRFIDLWHIPPDVMASKSDEQVLHSVIDRLVNPGKFLAQVNYLYQHDTEHSHDEIRLKDGLIFDRYSAPIFGPDEKYYGRVWYTRDVTERKRAEGALRESQQMLRNVLDQFPGVVFWKDRQSVYLGCNRAFSTAAGLAAPEEIVGKTDFDLPWAETEAAGYRADDRAVMTRGEPRLNIVEPQHQADDHIAWFDTSKVPLFDARDNVFGVLGVSRDITERKLAEAALQQAALIVENSPVILFRWQAAEGWPVVLVSQNVVQIGYRPDELLAGSVMFSSIIHPDDLERVSREVKSYTASGVDRFQQEYRIITKDGQVRWVDDRTGVERDGTGQATHYQGIVVDITERKLADEALRVSEAKLQLTLEAARLGDWSWDIVTGDIVWSAQCKTLYGLPPDAEITYERFLERVHPEHREDVDAALRRAVETRGDYDVEKRVVWPDGTIHWNASRGRVFCDADGQPVRLTGMTLDITDRKQAELERERLITELERKNAELERFTYTVSHDLKSPLITIKGFLGFLEKAAASGNIEQLRSDIARIGEAAKKMERLLSELLELSRIGRIINPPEAAAFETIAREAVELVRGQLAARQVTVTIAEALPTVYGDHARLVEVVQNLVDNAVKFMGDQPHPTIEIGARAPAPGEPPIFYVRDNGAGIEPQYHQQVFGLFDKLDARSEGTGVGLALVKRIVEVHGGRIWVESEGQGRGATFWFTLPVAGPPERLER